MYRLKSLKYLMTISMVLAILIVVSFLSQLIRITPTAQSMFQIADGILVSFIYLIPGPLGLFAGPLYGAIIDCITGYFITIPISIIVRIIMFFIVAYLSKYLTYYVSFFLALIFIIILYVPYSWILFGSAVVIAELITDSIQVGASYIIAVVLYLAFKKVNKDNYLWNDHEFDRFKPVKK